MATKEATKKNSASDPEAEKKNQLAVFEKEKASVLQEARSIAVIADPETANRAAAVLQRIKAARATIDGFFRPQIDRWLEGHRNEIRMFRTFDDPLAAAWNALKKIVGDYQIKVEAERRRVQEEETRKAREAQEDKANAEAAIAAAQGASAEVVEQVRAETVSQAPVPIVESPKMAGVSMREDWYANVKDKMALIRAIAEGKASPELVDPNMTKLNGLAKSLKKTMNVPGVEALSRSVTSVR